MKSQALQWLGFTCLVSTTERSRVLSSTWGQWSLSEKGLKRPSCWSRSYLEPGNKETIRKRKILNPLPLSQGYWQVNWAPEARKSPWGLLPFKSQSRAPSFLLKHNWERCFPLVSLSRLLCNSLKEYTSKAGEPGATLPFVWGTSRPSFPPCRQNT